MSHTNTTFKLAPKSDDPVVVETGKCFISKNDRRHIYRQHERFVLHLNLDLHAGDNGYDKHFLINTLFDNHLTEYIRAEWLDELDPNEFQKMYDEVKSLMP